MGKARQLCRGIIVLTFLLFAEHATALLVVGDPDVHVRTPIVGDPSVELRAARDVLLDAEVDAVGSVLAVAGVRCCFGRVSMLPGEDSPHEGPVVVVRPSAFITSS